MPPSPRPAPGQLHAGLAPDLPTIALAPEWKDQQRLWGHSFHPMCSYLATFPAALAHAFIARYSRPGDVVLDPFSGRGTVPLQAIAERRVGVGNDLNPLAHLLTAAKVGAPTLWEVESRLATLRIDWNLEADGWRARAASSADDDPDLPLGVMLSFHAETLAQLLFLRTALRLEQPADRFLAGTTLGILHGKSRSYLSGVMPNAFSLAPGYVRDYSARTAFRAEPRDVFAALRAKLKRLYRQSPPGTPGLALFGDARDVGSRTRGALRTAGLPDLVRLVVTSPPYLRVVKYGRYNWLRLWFMGIDPAVVDATLDDGHPVAPYAAFLTEVLYSLRETLADDAVVVLVVGDVEQDRGRPSQDGMGLAESVWEGAAAPVGYRLAGIVRDDVAADRKMTRLWGDEAGRATKTDALLVMAPTELGQRRARAAAAIPIDWTWPPRARPSTPARTAPPVRPASGGIESSRPSPSVYSPAYAADVSPGRPRGDGSAGPHEEPGPRSDDQPAAQLHPAAAGPSLRPRGEPAEG